MGNSDGKFACESCGKRYAWKPELAGRKVKCKCGAVMRVPESLDGDADASGGGGMFELAEATEKAPPPPPPGAGDRDDPGLAAGAGDFGLAGDSQIGASIQSGADACPGCGASMPASAVLCVQCGYNRNTGAKMGAASVSMDSEATEKPKGAASAKLGGMLAKMKGGKATDAAISTGDAGDDKLWKLKQREIPIALVLLGLAAVGFQGWQQSGTDASIAQAIGREFVGMLVGVVLLVGAAFITARMLTMSFGTLPTAILKFAAVYIAPGALGAVVAHLAGGDMMGWFIGLFVIIGMYFGLLIWLFDLDFFEAGVLAAIGYVINNIIIGSLMMGAMGG